MDNIFRICCENYIDTEELLAQFHLGSMLELCMVMHCSNVTPRCKFVFECLSTVISSLLFTACLLNCYSYWTNALEPNQNASVRNCRIQESSGGSRHHYVSPVRKMYTLRCTLAESFKEVYRPCLRSHS